MTSQRLWIGVFLAYLTLAPALAQLSMTGIGSPSTGPPPNTNCTSYTGIGDIVSGAKAFLGMRAYSSTSCNIKGINIRRASDNNTSDINILTTGKLDTSTASTFCTATNCFITKFYDQTGNSNDVIQNTAANQPALTFNCLNTSLPCATFNGSTDVLNANACSVSAVPATIGGHGERTGNTSLFSSLYSPCSGGGGGNNPFYTNAANSVGCQYGSSGGVTGQTANDNAYHSFICGMPNGSGATVNFVIDGTNHSAATGTTDFNTGTPANVGGTNFQGTFTEGFAYSSNVSVANMQTMCHNQSLYYATPSC